MNLICERDALHAALAHVASRARNKLKIPILQHVRIDAVDNRLTFTATDLDTRSEATLPAEISEAGSTTVSGDRLARLVDGMPQGAQVSLIDDDTELQVMCGKSRYKLPTLPVEDFPNMDRPSDGAEIAINGPDAKRLFGEPIAAAATTDDRKHLTGGFLHQPEPGKIGIICTSGIQLVRIVLPSKDHLDRGYILPKPAMAELLKLASRGEINIRVSNNLIEASSGNCVFTSKLIEATFPDLDRFMNGASEAFIMVDRTEFCAAFNRLKGLMDDGSTLNIEWSPGQPLAMTLAGEGSGSESVACECDIDAGLIAFSPTVLGPMLDLHKGDMLHLHMTSNQGPMKILDPAAPGLTVIAMPCRPR